MQVVFGRKNCHLQSVVHMAELRGDQADGLRRMLGGAKTRMVMLVSASARVGKTSIALNLAGRLAQRGRRVLLINENPLPGSNGVVAGLDQCPGNQTPVWREGALEAMLTRSRNGYMLLTLAPLIQAWPRLSSSVRVRVAAEIRWLENRCDVTLIDTPPGGSGGTGIFDGRAQDIIMIAVPAVSAVTASYALSKSLCLHNRQSRFHTLLNRVGDGRRAGIMLDNLTQAIRTRLRIPVESLGCVPLDQRLHAAGIGDRLVVEESPASPAAVRLRGIADVMACWPGVHAGAGFSDRVRQPLSAGCAPVPENAGA